MMRDDLERLRDADADFGLALAAQFQRESSTVPDVVCQIGTDGSLPTAANRFFKVIPVSVWGTEEEGQAGSFDPTVGAFYAYNVGLAVPALGATVVCTFTPFRWVFEY
jgi:hypothetical protein